ncbi:hypothetical protein MetMK1DRAFT_00005890 [Metallosphaera yellowstonensis MK1]|uniref:Uncharacterized protein n=1 Tax=Metallosphaera yellowstonensis MK1 TaxID=671065 RepID=H2C1G6_9CREN|nr:hypothetical protein MetMK1DRAFT_00005890 [Metallosphaera yellowstonensis MK1]
MNITDVKTIFRKLKITSSYVNVSPVPLGSKESRDPPTLKSGRWLRVKFLHSIMIQDKMSEMKVLGANGSRRYPWMVNVLRLQLPSGEGSRKGPGEDPIIGLVLNKGGVSQLPQDEGGG